MAVDEAAIDYVLKALPQHAGKLTRERVRRVIEAFLDTLEPPGNEVDREILRAYRDWVFQ